MRSGAVGAGMLLLALGPIAACGGSHDASSPATGGGANPIPSGAPPPPSSDGGVPSGGAGGDNGGATGGGTAGGSGGATGGAGGGTVPNACDGLAPSFGNAVALPFDLGSHLSCSAATTNPTGDVSLVFFGFFGGNPISWGSSVLIYSPDGRTQRGGVSVLLNGHDAGQPFVDVDPWFHWTSSGYQGFVDTGNVGPTRLVFRTWDGNGVTLSDLQDEVPRSSAPDGQGGSVVLAVPPGTQPATRSTLLWIDAAGTVRRSVTLDKVATVVAVNWATQHVVVVVTGSSPLARWFESGGKPITPWFALPGSVAPTSVHLLVDGRVVLRDGSEWDVALSDGVSGAVPVPEWLAARPATRLATIRQGRGYAVLPDDATHLEVLTPSGDGCGTVTLPADALSGVLAPQRLDVGQDGTLVAWAGRVVKGDLSVHCTFLWWPALLR